MAGTRYIVSTNGVDLSTTYASKARAIETANAYVFGAERMTRTTTEQTHVIQIRTVATGKIVFDQTVIVPALPSEPVHEPVETRERVRPVSLAPVNTPCAWSYRSDRCYDGTAIHVLHHDVPGIPAGTAVCGYHSPYDVTEDEREAFMYASDRAVMDAQDTADDVSAFLATDAQHTDYVRSSLGSVKTQRESGVAAAVFLGGVRIARTTVGARSITSN
jgi:hypothetical protein